MKSICAIALAALTATLLSPSRLAAQDATEATEPAAKSLTPIGDAIEVAAAALAADSQDAPKRPVAITYSEGYEKRAKIHKYASIATLPLFAAEFALGQSLYNDPQAGTSGKRTAHGVVGASLIGLFGVNSVTGVWNLWESRSAPGHRRRLVHGILMLASEAGFVAAAASAPGRGRANLINFDANKATHRNIALVSMGIGTSGYLFMLFSGH